MVASPKYGCNTRYVVCNLSGNQIPYEVFPFVRKQYHIIFSGLKFASGEAVTMPLVDMLIVLLVTVRRPSGSNLI